MCALTRLNLDRWFTEETETPIDPEQGFNFEAWLGHARQALGKAGLSGTIVWPEQARRKQIYAYLFDGDTPVGFAKVAMNDEHNRRLEHKAAVLRELAGRDFRLSRVPRLLADGEWNGHTYLIVESLPARAAPVLDTGEAFPREAAEEFAGEARQVDGAGVAALSWWARYEQRRTEECAPFDAELRRLISGGVRVRRQHGDLGPHKTMLVGGQLWIFDWEESCDDAPAAVDEVSYWVAAHSREFERRPAAMARRFAQRFLSDASRERRCDIMMALAFGYAIGMATAAEIVHHWEGPAPSPTPEIGKRTPT